MFYPVCLDIKNRNCLVVGGGSVARRKVKGLLDCEALVSVISPELHEDLAQLYEQGRIDWQKKCYEKNDIKGAFLVIAATNDQGAQLAVFEDASRLNILLNVADVPDKCNFILPARVQRGSLSVSVSTGGKSPALAKMLRKKMDLELDESFAVLNDIMGIIRSDVLAQKLSQKENETIFNAILDSSIIKHLSVKNFGAVLEIIDSCVKQKLTEETVEAIRERLC